MSIEHNTLQEAKLPDGRAEHTMAIVAIRSVAAIAPSKDTGRWICKQDAERRIFTAAVTLSGARRNRQVVRCQVCKPSQQYCLEHFTRVDAPPTQPSQPTIPQFFNPPAAK